MRKNYEEYSNGAFNRQGPITSAVGKSLRAGLLWAFNSTIVFKPLDGNIGKLFCPRFLGGEKLIQLSNNVIEELAIALNAENVTHRSLRLFNGRKASSWISEMLFFSMSLGKQFKISLCTFLIYPKQLVFSFLDLTKFVDFGVQQRHSATDPLSCSWNKGN